MKLNVIIIMCSLFGCMLSQGAVGLYVYASDKDNLFLQVDKYDDIRDERVRAVLKAFFDSCAKNKRFKVIIKEGVHDKEWLRKDKSGWTTIKPNGENWIFVKSNISLKESIHATRLEAVLSYVDSKKERGSRKK